MAGYVDWLHLPVSLFAYDRTWPHHHSSHICEGDDTSEFGVNIG